MLMSISDAVYLAGLRRGCFFSMNQRCSQVIAVDTDFGLFTRAWCVAEVHQAQSMEMPQRMIILSEDSLRGQESWLQRLKVEDGLILADLH